MEMKEDCITKPCLLPIEFARTSNILSLSILMGEPEDSLKVPKAVACTFGVTHNWTTNETAVVSAYLFADSHRYEWWSERTSFSIQRLETYWANCGQSELPAIVDAIDLIASALETQITSELRSAFSCESIERFLQGVSWKQLATHFVSSCRRRKIPLAFRLCRWLPACGRRAVVAFRQILREFARRHRIALCLVLI